MLQINIEADMTKEEALSSCLILQSALLEMTLYIPYNK